MARPLVLYLQGELGSGKTTLARGLLRELGIAGTVRSPTYTLLECYESRGQRVLHVDLYRLSEAVDLAPLGLRDEWVPGVLMLIEWPERAAQELPPPDLRITLALAPAGRSARLTAESKAGRAWLEEAHTRLYPEFRRV
jgi:tRNA threonylcarbamoyladenosine biosynthesis protein TsaE